MQTLGVSCAQGIGWFRATDREITRCSDDNASSKTEYSLAAKGKRIVV